MPPLSASMSQCSPALSRLLQGIVTLLYEQPLIFRNLCGHIEADGLLKVHQHLLDQVYQHAYDRFNSRKYHGYHMRANVNNEIRLRAINIMRFALYTSQLINTLQASTQRAALTDDECVAMMMEIAIIADIHRTASTTDVCSRLSEAALLLTVKHQWFATTSTLFVMPSSLFEAGLGLFTRINIRSKRGEWPSIIDFYGTYTNDKQLVDDYEGWTVEGKYGYHLIPVLLDHRVRGASCAASFANDLNGCTLQSNGTIRRNSGFLAYSDTLINNAHIEGGERETSPPAIVATRDIDAGFEIMVSYGSAYWGYRTVKSISAHREDLYGKPCSYFVHWKSGKATWITADNVARCPLIVKAYHDTDEQLVI